MFNLEDLFAVAQCISDVKGIKKINYIKIHETNIVAQEHFSTESLISVFQLVSVFEYVRKYVEYLLHSQKKNHHLLEEMLIYYYILWI